jgi:hypothetical protein
MLPLILIVLGAGTLAVIALSGRDKSTAEAAPELPVAPQQQTPTRTAALPTTNGRGEYGKKPKAPETAPSPKNGSDAASTAKAERDQAIAALAADLAAANKAKSGALQVMRQAADLLPSPIPTPTGPLDAIQAAKVAAQNRAVQSALQSAQAAYDAAQARASAAEAGLRKLGVNPMDIPKAPAPARGDVAR